MQSKFESNSYKVLILFHSKGLEADFVIQYQYDNTLLCILT